MSNTVKELIILLFDSINPKSARFLLYLEAQLIKVQSLNHPDKLIISKILSTIHSFGIDKISKNDLDQPLTNKQWKRLHAIVHNCYANLPVDNLKSPRPNINGLLSNANSSNVKTTIPKINMFELPSEALMLISNLFEEINKEGLDSNLTVPILNYYALLGILSTELTTLPKTLEPINKLFISHGWTESGFVAAPNRSELVKDLNFLLNTR